jgi:hypothetical protein
MGKIPSYMSDLKVRRKSQIQEKRIAGEMGGKVQKGSGALEFNKGDIRTKELLIEAKRTDKDSMSVKKEWLEKISMEAIAYNKIPALSIEFNNIAKLVERDWIAIPASFLKELIDTYNEVAKGGK